MTVDEIQIIVDAEVEKARKQIVNFVKNVKKELSSLSSSAGDLDFSNIKIDLGASLKSSISKASKEASKSVKDVTNSINNELAKAKLDELLNLDATSMSVDKLEAKLKELDLPYNYREIFNEEEIDKYTSRLIELHFQLQDLQNKMAETYNIKSLDQNEINRALGLSVEPVLDESGVDKVLEEVDNKLSTKKSEVKISTNAIAELPKITTLKQAIQNIGMTIKAENSNFHSIGNSIGLAMDIAKDKINSVTPQIKNMTNEVKSSFGKLTSNFKKISKGIGDVISRFKNLGDSSKKITSQIGTSFSNGIKSIKRFALSLLSVRTAFTVISKAAQAYLSFDTQLSDSIQNCWNALGSLLAPVLEYVVNLFSKATSCVATFIKTLTGIDLVARANAKALNNQAKATSNATKQLSGIDDINNLSSGSSSDTTTTITIEDVDTSAFDIIIEKIKMITDLFDGFTANMDFSNLELSFANLGSSLSVFYDGAVETLGGFIENFLEPLSTWTINYALPEFFNATANAIQNIDFEVITQAFNDLWVSLEPFAENVGDGLLWLYENVLLPLNTWVMNEVVPAFLEILSGALDVLNTAIEAVKPILTWLWETILQPMAEWTGGVITDVLNSVGDALKWIADNEVAMTILESLAIAIGAVTAGIAIFNVVGAIASGVAGVLGVAIGILTSPITLVIAAIAAIIAIIILCIKHWDDIKEKVSNVVGKIKEWVVNMKDKIVSAFQNIVDKITNVKDKVVSAFTTIKTKISDIWSSIWDKIKEFINKILGGLESFANGGIKAINKLLEPLSKLGNSVLKVLGITSFKFTTISEISIPRLATGTVATSPTIAMFGEYANAKTNPEIVSPVSLMADTFRQVMEEYALNSQGNMNLKVQVGDKTLFDDFIDYVNETSRRRGVSVFTEV